MSSIAIPAADARSECFPGPCRSCFSIAGITVEVLGNDPQSVHLGPQLRPFLSQGDERDIEVRIEWTPRLEPSRGRELFHSGSVWRVHESKGKFVFDFTAEHLGPRPYKRLVADTDFRKAQVILNREYFSSEDTPSALEYPLDELLVTHYLSLAHGVELHSCGMVRADGESFLFAGHSGAGKSTTTRLWTRQVPVEVLSDDRIIVRKKRGQFQMHGTPWHGEAAYASPTQAPVRRIFLLEHGAGNRIERVSRSAAVGELLARSFVPFYQPRFVEPVLALLEELVESVPCYRFQFVPDRTAVERILEFRD
jgi:hypothetical protein